MPTRLQVLIPIGVAAVIVGVAGMISLPSEVSIDANSNFLMGTVQLDDEILQVYIADNDPRRMRGLMWETQSFLADDKGMLFVFDEPGKRSMWMKNMQFHIDIIHHHKLMLQTPILLVHIHNNMNHHQRYY